MKRKEIAGQCLGEFLYAVQTHAKEKVLQLFYVLARVEGGPPIFLHQKDVTPGVFEKHLKNGAQPIGTIVVVDKEPNRKGRYGKAMCVMQPCALSPDQEWAKSILDKIRVDIVEGGQNN